MKRRFKTPYRSLGSGSPTQLSATSVARRNDEARDSYRAMSAAAGSLRVFALGCLAAVGLMVGHVSPSDAGEIVVPRGATLSGFGSAFYRGQTFVALPGKAEELTVYVGKSRVSGGVNFRVLVTELEDRGVGIKFPTNVLFESATLNSGHGSQIGTNPFTVDLGGLPLISGRTYAWILDAYVEIASNGENTAGVGISSFTGSGTYPDGQMITKALGPFPSGTREEHFTAGFNANGRDMAFTMTFFSSIDVAIDIRPGSDQNKINLDSAGIVPVAILSAESFDALEVNEDTIFLASASVKVAGASGQGQCHVQDVNQDGLDDLVCNVETAEFMIQEGQDTAELTAETFDGTPIRGEDDIEIVP